MKKLLLIVTAVFSMNAMAIEFISEEDVASHLDAEKVIEVSKYSIQSIIPVGNKCGSLIYSKSARAYIVKNSNKSYLVVTSSGLKDLTKCVEL